MFRRRSVRRRIPRLRVPEFVAPRVEAPRLQVPELITPRFERPERSLRDIPISPTTPGIDTSLTETVASFIHRNIVIIGILGLATIFILSKR